MDMIIHQLKSDQLHLTIDHCADRQQSHTKIKIFCTAKDILHQRTIRIYMPEWPVLFEGDLTRPFFLHIGFHVAKLNPLMDTNKTCMLFFILQHAGFSLF
jgi:hypothetical protein